MAKIITLKKVPQHCKRCKRALRKYNKSGLCSVCGEKERQSQSKLKDNKGLILMSLIFLGTLCFIQFASAELFQFDNVKSYDAVNKEVTIINTFGLGQDIAKIKLDTDWCLNNYDCKINPENPTEIIIPVGYQQIAELQINNYEDYSSILDKMDIYNIKGKQLIKTERQFDYKVKQIEEKEVIDYKTECSDFIEGNGTHTNLCYEVESGNHIEYTTSWLPLERFDFVKGDVVILGIFTQVNLYDNVEWIPTLYGKELTEFASYVQSSGTQTFQDIGGVNYTTLVYTSNGTFNVTGSDMNVSVLIIAGGGAGGGGTNSGGGGAGGLIWNNSVNLTNGNYSIIVGIGGNPVPAQNGGNGTNSSFAGLVAMGGGGGGNGDFTNNAGKGAIGGSAGGSGFQSATQWGRGFVGQGTDGGAGINPFAVPYRAGGGGGSGSIGINGSVGGLYSGGNGTLYNIYNGTSLCYAGGGGGGEQNVVRLGGCGGGNGGKQTGTTNPTNATNGTGGGGGGAYASVGGIGGNGIVIIRFETTVLINPRVVLNSPLNFTNFSVSSIQFNYTAYTYSEGTNINQTILYIDEVISENNITNMANGTTYLVTKVLGTGYHNWSVKLWDGNGTSNQSITIPFMIDTTLPLINISYPTNITYYVPYNNNATANPSINWNAQDEHLSYCTLTNLTSGVNITSSCNNMNYTFEVPFGTYTFRTYVNDTFLFTNSTSITATYKYKIFEINQSFNTPVLENTPQNYYANIYLDSSLSINNVYFNYNGTNYSASYSNIGNYTQLKELDFYTPSVISNANNTLTWWVLLNDSSRINLNVKFQQVNNFMINSVCNSTFPYYLFNFTLKDEKTQSIINGTIETDIRFKTNDGLTNLFNLTSTFYNTSSYLCSSYPITAGNSYKVDGTIKYYTSNENYSAMVEYYNFLNFSYNNNTYYQNISLYDLNVTEGTEFQLTFKDSSYRAREDILIYVYRQYIPEGIFKVVELPKTDSNGQAVVHLVRNDVIYNIIAVDSAGNVLGALNNVIAFCDDYTIGDCKINFQGTTTETNLENYIEDLGLTYTLSFNSATNLITFLFSFDTLQVKNIRLKVISSAVVTNRTICDTSLSAITGTLTCNVSSVVNSPSAVYVKIFLDNEEIINENLYLDTSDWNISGIIFFGFLLLLIIGIMFIESKEGLIIAVILGFIILISLGIVKGKIIGFTSGVLWLVIVGIILLIKLNKEKQQS